MPAPLDFYFDFGSPYGYFASLRVDSLAAAHGRTVSWHPILLGAVFKKTGSQPNTAIPLRGAYLKHDVHRIARLTGAPFHWPDALPVNGLAASRAFWWLSDIDPPLARRFAGAVFHAAWAEGRDIAAADAVAALAAGLGLDSAAVAAAVATPSVKDRLRRETDRAMERGVFGAPFLFVDGEPFWGWDRLDMVGDWLTGGGW